MEQVLRISEVDEKARQKGVWKLKATGSVTYALRDSLDNHFPACAPCNLFLKRLSVLRCSESKLLGRWTGPEHPASISALLNGSGSFSVDSGINSIVLRDEDGRTKFYSPAELNATAIEVFERKSLELRVGDSLRMTKTQKQAGHTAHEQYRVQALRDNGEVVLRNEAGEKVIEPGKVTAD